VRERVGPGTPLPRCEARIPRSTFVGRSPSNTSLAAHVLPPFRRRSHNIKWRSEVNSVRRHSCPTRERSVAIAAYCSRP
jgi:hypothetical protein